MTWDSDSLYSKAALYFERVQDEDRHSPAFAFWCALSLELLARSAVAKISPALLADATSHTDGILYALELPRRTEKPPTSIGTKQVIELCELLVDRFEEDERKVALALAAFRNAEL